VITITKEQVEDAVSAQWNVTIIDPKPPITKSQSTATEVKVKTNRGRPKGSSSKAKGTKKSASTNEVIRKYKR
jgi:hypothetical protein